jgi:phosphopantothenoylcysteine decarboxylase/phosphopantothenate--cysteine ligase
VQARIGPCETTTVKGKKIVLGVTGSIAAYKAAVLASKLVQAGAEVRAVLTRSAASFVGPLTFQTLTGHPVMIEMLEPPKEFNPSHIAPSEWADAIVIAPATANIMGKVACGIVDELVVGIVLATSAPVVVAPAMNDTMWNHPVIRANVAKLNQLGYHLVGPGEGWLACGRRGVGRMAEPQAILEAVREILKGE